jgi:hypothetical protein
MVACKFGQTRKEEKINACSAFPLFTPKPFDNLIDIQRNILEEFYNTYQVF